jgi:Flp pilus assembly protein TadG
MPTSTQRKISDRRKNQQSGNGLVEGALVFLVLFVMIFGIMDFGRMIWTFTLLSHGAREATRYAMVHGTASGHTASVSQIQGIVTSRMVALSSSSVTSTVTFTPDQNPGSTVKVAVSYNFTPLSPYIPAATIPMKSTSQMVIIQ